MLQILLKKVCLRSNKVFQNVLVIYSYYYILNNIIQFAHSSIHSFIERKGICNKIKKTIFEKVGVLDAPTLGKFHVRAMFIVKIINEVV